MRYFRGSLLVALVGLALGALLGWEASGTVAGTLATLFIVLVLAVLEVSLSFDNAVVNATVLRQMDPVWRRRFITWGIAIAVFGMRILFPLLIVAVIAGISPWAALVMAATDPDGYSRTLTSAHVSVAAFGGAFLAMVGLKHFFDHEKDLHWIRVIDEPAAGRAQRGGRDRPRPDPALRDLALAAGRRAADAHHGGDRRAGDLHRGRRPERAARRRVERDGAGGARGAAGVPV